MVVFATPPFWFANEMTFARRVGLPLSSSAPPIGRVRSGASASVGGDPDLLVGGDRLRVERRRRRGARGSDSVRCAGGASWFGIASAGAVEAVVSGASGTTTSVGVSASALAAVVASTSIAGSAAGALASRDSGATGVSVRSAAGRRASSSTSGERSSGSSKTGSRGSGKFAVAVADRGRGGVASMTVLLGAASAAKKSHTFATIRTWQRLSFPCSGMRFDSCLGNTIPGDDRSPNASPGSRRGGAKAPAGGLSRP